MRTDRPIRVLLIDDREDEYLRTRELLAASQGARFELEWERSSTVGLQKLADRRHDVCLLDYRLGEGNGLDFLRRAKATECTAPIVMLAGRGDLHVGLAALQAGATDFIDKGEISAALLGRAIRYAWQRAELLEKLRQLATHDELTGLYSRRELLRFLEEEVGRCRRYGNSLTFMIADIDRFKEVNDQFGDQVGDAVLRHVACLLQYTSRQQDRIGRYGSDEVGMLLPETSQAGALARAARGRSYVASHPYHLERSGEPSTTIPLSIAVGIACFPEDGDSDRELIRAATTALRSAQRDGGDRSS